MRIAYVNSQGKTFEFTNNKYIKIEDADLHKTSYGYTGRQLLIGTTVDQIIKEPCTYPVKLLFLGSAKTRAQNMDELADAAAYDRKHLVMGKLIRDEWSIDCYIMDEDGYPDDSRYGATAKDISFFCPRTVWTKENVYSFISTEIASNHNKDYPGKYPHRYANSDGDGYIINPNYMESNFKINIFGPVINPQVCIGENTYLVNVILEDGEYVTIDSRSKTVVKVLTNGEKVNAFHNRKKGTDFFAKIQTGRQYVSWTGKFVFDITIYEERSEPKWMIYR